MDKCLEIDPKQDRYTESEWKCMMQVCEHVEKTNTMNDFVKKWVEENFWPQEKFDGHVNYETIIPFLTDFSAALVGEIEREIESVPVDYSFDIDDGKDDLINVITIEKLKQILNKIKYE